MRPVEDINTSDSGLTDKEQDENFSINSDEIESLIYEVKEQKNG